MGSRSYGQDDRFLGYAFIAQGQGYQGKIKMLAVSDPRLTVLKGIEVIESVETPGLGAKIQEHPFKDQFSGLAVAPIECVKTTPQHPGQIKAITGATISSRAVVAILNRRIKELRQVLLDHE